MKVDLANSLAESIIARFQMLGMFTTPAVGVAYRNVLMAYDDDHGRHVVTQMLRDHREPLTDVELDRMLMPQEPLSPVRPAVKATDAARGRKIMREAWVESSCRRNNISEAEFFDLDLKAAREGKWEPLKTQWARVDRTIAARRAKGMPVDESGLSYMAPVPGELPARDKVATAPVLDVEPVTPETEFAKWYDR